MDSDKTTMKAAAWMMATIALFLLMAVSGRVITREIDVFQAMEMRSVIAFIMLLTLVYREGGFRAMRTAIGLKHLGRNEQFDAPLFLSHGTADGVWSVNMTRRLADRLHKHGRQPEIHFYEEQDHIPEVRPRTITMSTLSRSLHGI